MSGLRIAPVLIGAWWLLATPLRADEEKNLSPYAVCAHVSRGDEHPFARRELELMRKAGIGWPTHRGRRGVGPTRLTIGQQAQ